MKPGFDARRNLKGRPKLNSDQRRAMSRMRRWTPAMLDELELKLFGDPEHDIAPATGREWEHAAGVWLAFVMGKPGTMAEQAEAAPLTTEDALEARWDDMGAEDRVRDLERIVPIVTAALAAARAELAVATKEEEPAALPAAEGTEA